MVLSTTYVVYFYFKLKYNFVTLIFIILVSLCHFYFQEEEKKFKLVSAITSKTVLFRSFIMALGWCVFSTSECLNSENFRLGRDPRAGLGHVTKTSPHSQGSIKP